MLPGVSSTGEHAAFAQSQVICTSLMLATTTALSIAAVQCGILPYAGVDICLFELLKDVLLEKYDGEPPHVAIVGTGMLSSSVAQFVSYPLALVRTRLQVGQVAAWGQHSQTYFCQAALCCQRPLAVRW